MSIFMDVDAALAEVPVNAMPLLDDTDFKTIKAAVAYNAAGLALKWNFVTSAGAYTQTAVTPTTGGGDYDWTQEGNGMYAIKIPASGGASINNDTEGYGWFSGVATGVLPWAGPIIGFRASGLNDKLCDSAYDATRGLAGTALPGAAADAAGGLPISDAGGLDMDAVGTNASNAASRAADVQTRIPAALTADGNIKADSLKLNGATPNNLSAAGVNAEVVDALATDTYAEPGQETPAATNTLAAKIGYLFKAWRNKKDSDGTTENLYADDASTVDQKRAVSESGGTVTKGEVATGP